MNVDQSQPRRGEQPVRENFSIRGYDADIRGERSELCLKKLAGKFVGLQDAQSQRGSKRLDRAIGDLLAAAARAIRLGDNPGDRVGRAKKVLEGWYGEARRAEKSDAQGH